MRILHLINTLSIGGAERHLVTLCRHLRQRGDEVIVACLREHVRGSRSLRPILEGGGIRVLDLGAPSRYDVRYPARVARLLDRERPDILHTHLPRADLAGALVCGGRRFAIPWISSVHDIYSEAWAGRWLLPFFRQAWRRADAVVAISDAVMNWLTKRMRIPARKLRRIYYGIDWESFGTPLADLRTRWDLGSDFVIGTMGRLEPRKGHEILIRAMPRVLGSIPNAVLLIAGHDPWGYGGRLQAQADALGLHGRVRLVGFQADVPSFLHTVDVFAFASTAEGFGQVLIEAMAANRSVVASRIAPLTEIVSDGETGLLASPRDAEAFAGAMIWLHGHPAERRRMAGCGAEHVRSKFTATRMGVETQALYLALRS